VTLVNKNPEFRGEQVLIDRILTHPKVKVISNALTTAIAGDGVVAALRYSDGAGVERALETQGVFIHVGLIPNSSMVDFVMKTPTGDVIVDTAGRTNVPGFFAAGDVTNTPFKQIAVAAGQGVAAGLSAISFLNARSA
jgi:alkyl hydroperoxide reductase subunit AhpF